MATKITGTNTAAAPGVTGDDTDTGLFYGTNEIGFSTGGTSRLTLDSSGNLNIPNDSGKIQFGTGNDLAIYHDGNSRIKTASGAAGNLVIDSNNDINLRVNNSEMAVHCKEDGAVELYFDNAKKAETVTGGFTVTGVCTATSFAGSGASLTGISSQDTLSFRNLIANGAMQVNQRGSTAGLDDFNPVTSSLYTLDRWRAGTGSSFDWDSARVKQVGDSPDEFSNSLRVDIGNTETPGAGQNALIHQYIEAKNLQHLAYGTSSAKSCTLSFWVRSNKTGTYCAQISQHDAGKYLMYEYSISSANTWEKKTITFSGNTSDAISNDTGIGLEIAFHLTCHSDDHVAATTSWTAKPGGGGGSKYLATSNQVNLWDHADNVWYLTGVQLEIGSTATDFEMRPYGDELARCQRYYYKKPMFYSACMTYTPGSGEHNFTRYGTDHPVQMRAAPSFVGGDFALWSWSSATSVSKANITYSGDHGVLASSLSVACTAANGAAPANGPGSGNMMPCRQLDAEFNAEL